MNNLVCIKSSKNIWLRKIGMLIYSLTPILAWYKISFPVSLGYALILFLSAYVIVLNKFKINVVPKNFWLLFVYVCIMWTCNNNFGIWTLLPPGGWLFFMFVLAVLGGVIMFDLSLLKRYMRWIVLLSIALFWVQYILLIITGSQQICFVPPLTGTFTYENLNYSELVARHLSGKHPCSIFLEKSYMAYYLITYLALEWFAQESEKKWFTKEIALIIVTLIVLRSGSGLVGLVALFIVKAFYLFWDANIVRRVIMLFLVTPLLIGASFFYIRSQVGQEMISRSEELYTEGSSGYSRIVAGYLLFEQMNVAEKILGISGARDKFGEETSDGKVNFYINGVQTILINLGYIGAFLHLLFYVGLFSKVSLSSKMSIMVLLIMGLLESNYLNPYMMLLTVIPCADYYVKNNYIL